MTEEINTTEKQFGIQKIYCKDISFETPSSPQVFTEKWDPTVDFNLGTNVAPLDAPFFEITLTITITVKNNDTVAYLIEAKQAGIFSLAHFTDQEMGHMVGSFCPTILFPYAREAISDLVIKGGFPQLLLAPVNFDALYAQHLQQAQQVPGSETIN